MSNENELKGLKANNANRVLGTVISNEELCRRKCLDCGYDGGDIAKDSCVSCGCRFEPDVGEDCPECGSDEYDTHCPACDSDNIVYWDEYQAMLDSLL